MKIIVPMSGIGKRFVDQGYILPKPLIEIEGKPIIAHVINMFSNEKDFIFICNEEHIRNFSIKEKIKEYAPNSKIISIDKHKNGPVYAVSKAFDLINDNEDVIVNYCDFCCYWDYTSFKNWLKLVKPDGCLVVYKGFHPHSLGNTNYAFLKTKDGLMEEIQEKKPYTKNKLNEYASSGTYYFSKGIYLKQSFKELMEKKISIKGEYYCSLPYNLLQKKGYKINYYELEHFMQWGTPQDFEEYKRWSDSFKNITNINKSNNEHDGTTLITMAGKGSRFKLEEYKVKKPLINVSGRAMFVQAVKSLPQTKNYHFFLLNEFEKNNIFQESLNSYFPSATYSSTSKTPNGQAISVLKCLDKIDNNKQINISSCDHGLIYDQNRYENFIKDSNFDVAVWTTTNHFNAQLNPQMYGWVSQKNSIIEKVSVKSILNDPKTDPMIIGTFSFKNGLILKEMINSLISRNKQINNEFYLDSAIEDALRLGFKCMIFPVDYYFSWGTPNELKTFNYWQSCFHKWQSHPYRVEKDKLFFNNKYNYAHFKKDKVLNETKNF